MKLFKKPVFVSVSPNAEADDVWLALRLLFSPWRWIRGGAPARFKDELQRYLGIDRVFLFDSGRTSLYAILTARGLQKDDEVLVQAFTCTAAVNPILWFGAKPVYVDIDANTYNMEVEDLKRKISLRSRILIVQHTFGIPANLDAILKVAHEHDLFVIEDVAHALGGEHSGKKLGTFGDAAIFSFGRYKIISSVFGGAAIAREKSLGDRLEELHREWSYPSYFWIFGQLFYPVLLSVAKPFYNFLSLGKIPVVLARKLSLISPSVYAREKQGGRPGFGPSRMPNALAVLGSHQLKKLVLFNDHRRELADAYRKRLENSGFALPTVSPEDRAVFLTFPIQVLNEELAFRILKKSRSDEGMYLENWPAKKVIGPQGTSLEKLRYEEGRCPVAESVALRVVTLPTNPRTTIGDANRVADFLRLYGN